MGPSSGWSLLPCCLLSHFCITECCGCVGGFEWRIHSARNRPSGTCSTTSLGHVWNSNKCCMRSGQEIMQYKQRRVTEFTFCKGLSPFICPAIQLLRVACVGGAVSHQPRTNPHKVWWPAKNGKCMDEKWENGKWKNGKWPKKWKWRTGKMENGQQMEKWKNENWKMGNEWKK